MISGCAIAARTSGLASAGELGPFGDDHGRVGARHRLGDRGGDLQAGQRRPVGHRVPAAHLGALGDQTRGEHDRGRLTHVVGAGLEGEAEQRDPLAAQ